jgi:hypothetical protein
VGFQGTDPQTDFRGMGSFGLACVVDFAANKNQLYRAYVQQYSQALGSTREYPLAVAIINFASLLGELLEWKTSTHFFLFLLASISFIV